MGKETAKEALEKAQVDILLITKPANMQYYAGFLGEGYVVVSKNKRLVVTDSRYTESAVKQCPDYEVVLWKTKKYYDALCECIKEESAKSLGFEDETMTVSQYNKLHDLIDVKMVPLKDCLDKFRQIKTKEEIDIVRKCEAIGDKAFEKIVKDLKPGITEKKVAALLELYMKEEGADTTSFDTIAASGINSSMPHAIPTDKVLEEGDFLTMDFGCRYKGYCSDMTRTVVIGKADAKQMEIYNTVLEAQKAAIAGIKPGMKGSEVDSIAREIIKKAGYGEYFGHALGHSVGIEIHEIPCFSPKDDNEIRPGMIISVEPGIYIEGFGGVRIEDLIVVTENGVENLTNSPKELMEI